MADDKKNIKYECKGGCGLKTDNPQATCANKNCSHYGKKVQSAGGQGAQGDAK